MFMPRLNSLSRYVRLIAKTDSDAVHRLSRKYGSKIWKLMFCWLFSPRKNPRSRRLRPRLRLADRAIV